MDKKKPLIYAAIPIILAITLSYVLQITVISKPEEVVSWFSSFGPFVYLAYAVVQIITIIIAPIGGMFAWIAFIAIVGPEKGLIIYYLVSTPAYFANFYLARKYGRPLVKKIVGNSALDRIDSIAKNAGTPTLIILKLFQGGYFDYISYAAGLTTQIKNRTFLLVNIFGGIPATLITYALFKLLPNFTTQIIGIYIVTGVFIAISLTLNRRFKKKKSS